MICTKSVAMKISFISLIFFRIVSGTDGFLVHGSAGPLTAQRGRAVLLPCFVDRPLPLEELEVEWRRTDSGIIVHLLLEGQSRPESQGDAYRGRAHFFAQEIPKGNFSLLLEGVRTTDTGVYKCVIYTVQGDHETRLEIQRVEWLVVAGTDEPVYPHAGEDVTLSCSVDTHVNVTELHVEWRKTDNDMLVLLYANGKSRPESQHDRYSGRAEFFSEEIPKGNFSMKLKKVRVEDKGEFMCKVNKGTDSASTTARISTLGYSFQRWLTLVLCFVVILAVLITGTFSLLPLKMQSQSRQALFCHCLHITAPSIVVFIAFMQWGLTEGSTEETITCTSITLLNILVLFNLAPQEFLAGVPWKIKRLAQKLGSTVFMVYIGTVTVIDFSTKYSTYTCDKVALGVFIAVFIATIIFTIILQIVYFYLWWNITPQTFKKILVAVAVMLTFLILLTISAGVFHKKYFSATAGTTEMIIVLVVSVMVILLPFVGYWIVLTWYLRKPAEEQLPKLNYFFICLPIFLNFLILAQYNQLIAWIHNTFTLEYFLLIAVVPWVIFASFATEIYLHSFRLFYLCQRVLVVIVYLIHLILSFQYVNLTLGDDKERLAKLGQYAFIYSLTVTSFFDDWLRAHLLDRPRIILYKLGAFGLPLVNSIALAAVLILKADTGKQSLDLRVIVFLSESVILFSWFLIKITEYTLDKEEKIIAAIPFLRRRQNTRFDQETNDSQELTALSPPIPLDQAEKGQKVEQNIKQHTRN